MTINRVRPTEAHRMMAEEGYVYVDVRSITEFEEGHPEGAYNVPLKHMTPEGMSDNPDFLDVMEVAFERDAPLILGCRSGGRSLRAAERLEAAGFTRVIDQCGGYIGPAGGPRGWQPEGLPTSREAAPERTYSALEAKLEEKRRTIR